MIAVKCRPHLWSKSSLIFPTFSLDSSYLYSFVLPFLFILNLFQGFRLSFLTLQKKKIFLAIHCLTPHQGPTSSASWWLKTSPGSRWAVSPADVKQVGSGRQSVVKETQVSLCLLWTLDIWEQSRSPSPRHTRLVSMVAFAEGGRSRSRGQEEKDEEGASAWHREAVGGVDTVNVSLPRRLSRFAL